LERMIGTTKYVDKHINLERKQTEESKLITFHIEKVKLHVRKYRSYPSK
jgi:hypothetical protein